MQSQLSELYPLWFLSYRFSHSSSRIRTSSFA
nr:MAG TPA: hypothetical protein [Caudoviricetes sp.]